MMEYNEITTRTKNTVFCTQINKKPNVNHKMFREKPLLQRKYDFFRSNAQ